MKHFVGHKGKVVSVSETGIDVKIERNEACSGCKNKTSCQMGKVDEQIISVKTKQKNIYSLGEEVLISMKTSLGLKAVLYAYVLPFLLLLIAFVIAYRFIVSEVLQIIFALIPVFVYYTILYKIRHRMEKTFQVYISKIEFED
jgi:sigma-E factor negative regulatory protein RseC